MTMLMGVVGRFPLALAAGLGVNALVAYEIAPKMTWADAMGLVVIEGVIITVLVLTGLRKAVFSAVPTGLKTAIAAGIGMFLVLIGLVDSGFVRRQPSRVVPVGLGINGRLIGWPTLVFVFALLLTLILMVWRVRGAILIGILAATALALIIEAVAKVGPSFTPPDTVNPTGWSLNVPAPAPTRCDHPRSRAARQVQRARLLADGRLAGRADVRLHAAADRLLRHHGHDGGGRPGGRTAQRERRAAAHPRDPAGGLHRGRGRRRRQRLQQHLLHRVGGRRRRGRAHRAANLVTGLLFLVAMFVSPFVAVVPFEAASAALVVVGFLMLTSVRNIDWTDYEIAIPAFLTIVLMPFTYSISNGIGAGLISYVVLKAVRGKAREIHPLLWAVAVLFLLYFLRGELERLLF